MLGPRSARVAALAGAALLLVACGGGGVSSEEAREIIVAGLVDDAGLARDVAECVADGALAEHDPGDLVNERGITSDAVNESVAAITAGCLAEHAPAPPPTTVPATVPTTTVPATTTASTVPLDLTAFCDAAHDLVVVIRADDHMDDPGPPALEELVTEGLDRAELAVLTAPDNAYQEAPLEIVDRFEQFRDTLAEVGFDIEADETVLASLEDDAEALSDGADELTAVLAGDCEMGDGVGDDLDTEAAELAADLIALDDTDTSVPSDSSVPGGAPAGDYTAVFDEATNIEVRVPAAWSAQESGVEAGGRRYLVRSDDLAAFNAPGVAGDGVRIVGVDGTDYAALLAGIAPSQSCTLDGEDVYDDGVYVGTVRMYSACAGGSVTAIVVAAADDEAEVSALVEIHLTTPNDAAIDEIVSTFYV
jgi:hypothetical protein